MGPCIECTRSKLDTGQEVLGLVAPVFPLAWSPWGPRGSWPLALPWAALGLLLAVLAPLLGRPSASPGLSWGLKGSWLLWASWAALGSQTRLFTEPCKNLYCISLCFVLLGLQGPSRDPGPEWLLGASGWARGRRVPPRAPRNAPLLLFSRGLLDASWAAPGGCWSLLGALG